MQIQNFIGDYMNRNTIVPLGRIAIIFSIVFGVLAFNIEDLSATQKDSKNSIDSKIAFVSARDGNAEIYIINPDGSGLTNLSNNPASDHSPAWSPDGSKIAFRSRRGEGAPTPANLYVMDADGSNLTRLVTKLPGDDGQADYTPRWSPDGSRILFVAGYSIYVVNLDGSNLTNLTLDSSLRTCDYASWSPDGSKIVFQSGRDIYVMKADGSHPIELTEGIRPAWHPDGSKIAFGTMGKSGSNIFSMNSNGSESTRLTDIDMPGIDTIKERIKANRHFSLAAAYLPSWSPDGSMIAFNRISNDDIYGVVVMNADGSSQVRLTGQLLFDMQQKFPISWSPDGTRIVLTRMDKPLSKQLMGEDVNHDIYTVNVDGTGLTRLTDHPAGDFDPIWSPIIK